jgi:hypothetical protein
MMMMLRDEKLRNTNVEVATDSTVRPDKAAEKEEATEFAAAVAGYFQGMLPVATQAPPMIPLVMEIFKAVTKPFKFGRQLEEQIDATADQLSMMAVQMQQAQMMAAAMGPPPDGGGDGSRPSGRAVQ